MLTKFFLGWLFVIWGGFTFLCALYELILIWFAPTSAGLTLMIIAQLGVITIALGMRFVLNE